MTEDFDNNIIGHDALVPEKERASKIAEEVSAMHDMSVRARHRGFAEDGRAVFDLKGKSDTAVEAPRTERRRQERLQRSYAIIRGKETAQEALVVNTGKPAEGNITPFRSKHLLPR